MKKLLKRLLILAAPIVWRKIQQRRHGRHRAHHGHHHHGHHWKKHHRSGLDWL